MNKLAQILREEGLRKTSSQDYTWEEEEDEWGDDYEEDDWDPEDPVDGMGSPIPQDILSALSTGSARDLAQAVLRHQPLTLAESYIEGLAYPASKVRQGPYGKFLRDATALLGAEVDKARKREWSSSPYKKELLTLGDAARGNRDFFTPGEVRVLQWQPRKKGGVFTSAYLEDIDSQLGGFRAMVTEAGARKHGTTLKKVFEALGKLGGKMVTRGMGQGKKKPWTDYDGWAY